MALTTSDQIARAALRILAREGAAAVSMRRVARAVKITPMAIYHHFPTRQRLLHAVVDREFNQFQAMILQEKRRGSHPSLLLHSLDAYLRYAFAQPRIFDYLFSEVRPAARRYPEDFRTGRSPTLNTLADLVRAAMRDGYLRRADVWEVTFELWAHVHGYVVLQRAGRFNLSETAFTALVHRSLNRLLHGLKKP